MYCTAQKHQWYCPKFLLFYLSTRDRNNSATKVATCNGKQNRLKTNLQYHRLPKRGYPNGKRCIAAHIWLAELPYYPKTHHWNNAASARQRWNTSARYPYLRQTTLKYPTNNNNQYCINFFPN